MKSLNEIIGQAKLTKVGTIIGNYIIDHTTEACFMTSTELAQTLDVSEASIIRFSRSIGFGGYMDFQKYLQKCHLDTLTKVSSQIEEPAERFVRSIEEHPGELHFGIEALKIGDAALRSVFMLNGTTLFNEALQLILDAHKIYIASGRSNIGLGSRLYYLLKQILPNVYTTGMGTGNAIDHMCDITEDDCLLLFYLPRYSNVDLTVLQLANDAGADIVLITDIHNPHLSAVTELATKVFRIDVGSNSFFPTFIGANFLIELIANGISREIGNQEVQERLERLEHYTSKFDSI